MPFVFLLVFQCCHEISKCWVIYYPLLLQVTDILLSKVCLFYLQPAAWRRASDLWPSHNSGRRRTDDNQDRDIRVTDIDDSKPVFGPPVLGQVWYFFDVPENAAFGQVIAVDADSEENAVATYSVVSSWGSK